jgi:hypothetical protein
MGTNMKEVGYKMELLKFIGPRLTCGMEQLHLMENRKHRTGQREPRTRHPTGQTLVTSFLQLGPASYFPEHCNSISICDPSITLPQNPLSYTRPGQLGFSI